MIGRMYPRIAVAVLLVLLTGALAMPARAASCPALSSALARGARGANVAALQRFLIARGLLSADSATGYFGPLTERAVQALQRANGIVSSGTPATTGFGRVGARTRALIAARCASPAPASPKSPVSDSLHYLLFQVGSLNPLQPVDEQVKQIVTMVGERGDHVHQQLGFVTTPLYFDFSDRSDRQVINDAFKTAEEQGVAVAFHIDDGMFWINRPDLWQDSANTEWSDWSGTVVPHRALVWAGDPTALAPPMCYNAPAIKAEVARKAKDVIGAEIKKNVDRLNAEGKGYLFAGVISGWETREQDDSEKFYGYCALTNLGYSATKPPSDPDEALVRVMNDYITLWTTSLEQAGIPREKVYTHMGYRGGPPTGTQNPLRTWYFDVPPESAFNPNAVPGFTMYDGDGATFAQLYGVLAAHPATAWGISEGGNVSLAHPESGLQTMENYLAKAFNHGAGYVNIYGYWNKNIPNDPIYKAMSNTAAIAAYQKFLKGEAIFEAGVPGTIQGYKIYTPDPSNIPAEVASQPVLLDDSYTSITNPYVHTPPAGQTYRVSVPSLKGYSIGYTLCIDSTSCHAQTPAPGTVAAVALPSGAGHYADLWWHYAPVGIFADLTVNGASEVTVGTSDAIALAWASVGAASASASITSDTPDTCGSKLSIPVSVSRGSYRINSLGACRAGHTYTITYTVTSANSAQASDSVVVRVR